MEIAVSIKEMFPKKINASHGSGQFKVLSCRPRAALHSGLQLGSGCSAVSRVPSAARRLPAPWASAPAIRWRPGQRGTNTHPVAHGSPLSTTSSRVPLSSAAALSPRSAAGRRDPGPPRSAGGAQGPGKAYLQIAPSASEHGKGGGRTCF